MDLQIFNLSYFDKNSKFGNIELDAVLSQDVTLSNIVSEHPYEDGEMVADGIHNEPIKISLSAVISDLPQTFVEQAKQLSNTNLSTLMGNKYLSNSKSLRAWKDLYALWKAKQLLQITTPLQFEPFEDMAILQIKVSVEDTESLTFSADLKQLPITKNLTKLNLAPEIGKQSVRQ